MNRHSYQLFYHFAKVTNHHLTVTDDSHFPTSIPQFEICMSCMSCDFVHVKHVQKIVHVMNCTMQTYKLKHVQKYIVTRYVITCTKYSSKIDLTCTNFENKDMFLSLQQMFLNSIIIYIILFFIHVSVFVLCDQLMTKWIIIINLFISFKHTCSHQSLYDELKLWVSPLKTILNEGNSSICDHCN